MRNTPHPFAGRPVTLHLPGYPLRKGTIVGESVDRTAWRIRLNQHRAYVQNIRKLHVTFDDEPQEPVDLMLPSYDQARLYAAAFSV